MSVGSHLSHRTHPSHGPMRAAAILVVTIVAAFAALAVATMPTDARTIVRGMQIADDGVGGMTADEATKVVLARVSSLRLPVRVQGTTVVIAPDATYAGRPIAHHDVAAAVSQALAVGRQDHPVAAVVTRVRALAFGDDIAVPTRVDRDALRAHLIALLDGALAPAKDAAFSVSLARGQATVTVTPSVSGTTVEMEPLLDEIERALRSLSLEPIVADARTERPRVRTEDATLLIPAAERALARVPLTLSVEDERWTLSQAAIAEWLSPVFDDGIIRLGIDHEKASAFLTARATAITTVPKDAMYEEKDGKVKTFVPGVNGATLDVDDAIRKIDEVLTADEAPRSKTIELAIKPVPPTVTTEGSNPYGIKEIVGIGESNFAGSPKNRRHNIRVGAAAVDGTIVPAGEEFSMLKTLGPIDASTGYLEELVIKGNKTTPEYGGGLCQIGSTAFRAALDTGLPITERRNHSYRVSYYERDGAGKYIGPGKDATIYDPAPDFRFKNDTAHAILIRTEIDGNTLRFIYWGVRDGRTASQTDSVVSNIVPPPEKKVVETDELPPGEEKCTEKPHPGSNAIFSYTVTYPNGEVKTTDFKSHYRPWQEVCLIGRDPNKPLDTNAPTDGTVISADASGATGGTTP